ncbi:RNA helicase [Neophaeococcomyces mojaviensis]|uniref:RNA helicase n=1 Tax=Neophaeococcomyces mojaviensis TaxID=3383035 RepID=A0ACC3A873_9EURO|nr:RNA helicase [Knufia sp. JES_112]
MASVMRQHKKPTRMQLADDVSRSSRAKKNDMESPFGGMNRVDPGPRLRDPNKIPESIAPRPESGKSTSTTPKNKDDRPLFHALKMQTALTSLSYSARTNLKDKLDKIDNFEMLGLRPDVLEALRSQALGYLETLTPSPVQRLAIPALLSKKGQFEKSKKTGPDAYDKFLIAAETGSGKTLAYMLPIIDGIKKTEDIEKAEAAVESEKEQKKNAENIFEVKPPELADVQNPNSTTGRPRAIVLLPSSELVDQVGKVIKVMSHTVKYRSASISSSNSATVIKNRLFNPNGIDVIVSTPHLISSIAQKEPKILSKVNYLVVDEADSLFDRSFREITLDIIDRAAPSLKQLILCSATIPKSLDTFIDKRFPMMKRLVTPKIHSIPRRVQLGVLDIDKEPYRGNRAMACADAIWQLGKAEHDDTGSYHAIKHIIVFVNEREMAEELTTFLSSKGIDATALTRDTTEARRGAILDSFTSPSRIEGKLKDSKNSKGPIPFDIQEQSEKPSSRKLTNTKVLVTTDLGSRGIDTLAVRHAILYDVPHTTIDFVHRLGRLGRMNRRGRGIVLVGKKDRKDIVREVRDAMFRGQALI